MIIKSKPDIKICVNNINLNKINRTMHRSYNLYSFKLETTYIIIWILINVP